ncbi:hypothetical protein M1N84_00525 [Dehalococcoidia bacterium]|nr:hypothetical protein [Dehalococcoidia bacterium]
MEVKQAPALEERMARVEGILEEVRARLNHLDSRFEHLETRFEHLQTRFEHLQTRVDSGFGELRREMQIQFRWTLGIMLGVLIPMWVTIILTILVAL